MAETPTPWEAVPSPVSDCQWMIRVAGTKMHAIAMTSQGNDEANAKAIVRAVNSHAKLRAALEGMVRVFDARADLPSEDGELPELDAARRALEES